MSDERRPISRRDLLRTAGAAAAAASLSALARRGDAQEPATPSQSVAGMRFEPRDVVRMGVVGCGGRGMSLLSDLVDIPKVEIRAVCDVVPEKVAAAQALATKRGMPRPEGYAKGDHDFENLCRRGDLDLVYLATPWSWHVEMAVAAMRGGAHAGVEVPAATTLEGCFTLVETSERTRRHCVMLENCCYGRSEMLLLNMVRAGMLGELLHAEAAYIHDLRQILFESRGEGLWRRAEHLGRNGNLYPTHGLGPVARCLEINRGDRFQTLVSMSSKEAGLSAWRKQRVREGDPKWQETYTCGDMSTTLIRTARGRTIVLQHDVANPRPYDRINLVAGTKGIFRGYPDRVYLEGQEGGERFTKPDRHRARFEDPLWRRLGKQARKSGHGGMDYVMSWRLVQCLREGLAPDMDVYDAAAWSAPGPLSERSVAGGSVPVEVPDFTRGRWAEPRA